MRLLKKAVILLTAAVIVFSMTLSVSAIQITSSYTDAAGHPVKAVHGYKYIEELGRSVETISFIYPHSPALCSASLGLDSALLIVTNDPFKPVELVPSGVDCPKCGSKLYRTATNNEQCAFTCKECFYARGEYNGSINEIDEDYRLRLLSMKKVCN